MKTSFFLQTVHEYDTILESFYSQIHEIDVKICRRPTTTTADQNPEICKKFYWAISCRSVVRQVAECHTKIVRSSKILKTDERPLVGMLGNGRQLLGDLSAIINNWLQISGRCSYWRPVRDQSENCRPPSDNRLKTRKTEWLLLVVDVRKMFGEW